MATDSSIKTSYTVRETTNFESSPRPSSYGHSVVINRTSSSYGLGGRGSATVEKSTKSSSNYQSVPEGTYTTLAVTGASEIKGTREQEKRDMQDLNNRFADYLERVRSLEALNRSLADDLEKLKVKWGKETAQIKAMFQAELDEARRQLDDVLKEKARLEIRATSLEEEIEDIRLQWEDVVQLSIAHNEKFESQNGMLSEYEVQIQMLRKSIDTFEKDRDKTQALIAQVEESLATARQNLDEETLGHIDCENRGRTLEEEIEFMKRIHAQEMKEVGALAYSGTAAESRDYWKTQMAQAIKEIEQMYDDKMQSISTTMKASYDAKVQQIEEPTKASVSEQVKRSEDSSAVKAELTDLKNRLSQLSDQNQQLQRELDALRRRKEQRERELEMINDGLKSEAYTIKMELDGILRQLTHLMDMKLALEIEIATYRKLLEGEENRLNAKGGYEYKSDISSLLATSTIPEREIGSSASGELRAKTTFQTSAKGSLSISDCAPNGHFVRIENKGRKEESLVGWKITRSVDGKPAAEFTFNDSYGNIAPGKRITVWAQERKPPHALPLDTEIAAETWGVGAKAVTKLQNPEGEDRATHVQTTVYS